MTPPGKKTPLYSHALEAEPFTAADGCSIREVVHPARHASDPAVSLARAVVAPGKATTPHKLDFIEIYYVLSGQGLVHLDQDTHPLTPEACVYIPAGTVQWVRNTGDEDLVFLCVCTPAYDPAGDHPA